MQTSTGPGGVLVGVRRASVVAVLDAIAVAVGVRSTAATEPDLDLVGIGGTGVHTVECPVGVGVELGDSTATGSRGRLVRIGRTPIAAVGEPVVIAVEVGNATAADTRRNLVGVVGARVFAVEATVGVRVHVRGATTTDAGHDLVGIVHAAIDAVRSAIAVGVSLRDRAPTLAGEDLVGVHRTRIAGITRTVPVAILLFGVHLARAVVAGIPKSVAVLVGCRTAAPRGTDVGGATRRIALAAVLSIGLKVDALLTALRESIRTHRGDTLASGADLVGTTRHIALTTVVGIRQQIRAPTLTGALAGFAEVGAASVATNLSVKAGGPTGTAIGRILSRVDTAPIALGEAIGAAIGHTDSVAAQFITAARDLTASAVSTVGLEIHAHVTAERRLTGALRPTVIATVGGVGVPIVNVYRNGAAVVGTSNGGGERPRGQGEADHNGESLQRDLLDLECHRWPPTCHYDMLPEKFQRAAGPAHDRSPGWYQRLSVVLCVPARQPQWAINELD